MGERLDPWGSGEITDYDHLYKEFGIQKFTEKTQLDHRYFRRNIAIAHRDFDKYVDDLKNKENVYCMTGIASSGKFHIGHMSIINFVRFFEDLGVDTFFAVADVDAYTSREKIKTMADAKQNAVDNLAHINPGKRSAVFLQIADILYPQITGGKRRGVVPIALDQDPHIRATRDVARRLPHGLALPSSVYVKHIPGLKGPGTKMSSSDPHSALFLDDTPDEVERKIKKYAYSGGKNSVKEHREKGGDPDVDVSFQLLRYFEPSDEKVAEIRREYRSGELLTGELKQITIDLLRDFFEDHHDKLDDAREQAKQIISG